MPTTFITERENHGFDAFVPLLVQVNRASDIQATLRLSEDFDIDVVILGGAEAWMVADTLAAHAAFEVAFVGAIVNGFFERVLELQESGRATATREITAAFAKCYNNARARFDEPVVIAEADNGGLSCKHVAGTVRSIAVSRRWHRNGRR